MKKILLLIGFVFCSTMSMLAQKNTLSINDFAVAPGQDATAIVNLVAAAALEDKYIACDITMPEGLTFDAANCAAADGVKATFNKRKNGDLRVGIQALTADAGTKALFTFKVTAADTFTGGVLSVSNATIGDDDVDDFTVNVTADNSSTAVTEVKSDAAAKNGKFISNDKVVIVKNGKQYNTNGIEIK